MNIRLKIICFLFAVAYLFVIGCYFAAHMSFNADIHKNKGNNQGKTENTQQEKINGNKQDKEGFHGSVTLDRTENFDVMPIDEYSSTPMLNKRTGDSVYVTPDAISVKLKTPENAPNWIDPLNNINLGVHILVVLVFIYIPFIVFRTIRSIAKNNIFDIRNIKRIRKAGYALLICFICCLISNYISIITAREMIELEHYRIIFKIDSGDNAFLMLGLVSLLFAEILKISTSIKEENDLTV